MDKRSKRAFRPGHPTPLEERLAPGNFLGDLGDAFVSLGRRISDPYVRLGRSIAGVNSTPRPRNPTYTSMQIRRWTVIARVVSGELTPPQPTSITPLISQPPPMPDAS